MCKKCGDHGKKGKRGGFKFDGDSVGYHCFNCGANPKYVPGEQSSLSRQMVEVLTAFGIPDAALNSVEFYTLEHLDPHSKPEGGDVVNLEPNVLSLPDHFYRLGERDDSQTTLATYHLEERGMSPTDYPFFLSDTTNKLDLDWKARLIIPAYKNGNLIFYQGRDLLNTKPLKYKSVSTPRDCVLYGYDELSKYNDDPLYVVEGFFDAFHIGGVAVICNELTQQHIQILNRCPRPKVVIPDRRGKGYVMAKQAIAQSWQVSFPDIGSCKDIDEAINKYGHLYVKRSIITNTMSDFEAELHMKLLCT